MTKRLLAGVSAGFLLAALAGCGASNVPAKVNGKVSYEGAPVTGGTITYHHTTSGNYPTEINPDGTYSLTDLPTGDYTVTVDTSALDPDRKRKGMQDYGKGGSGGPPMPGGGVGGGGRSFGGSPTPEGAKEVEKGVFVKIPEKYADKAKSGVLKTVVAGKNTLDVELTK